MKTFVLNGGAVNWAQFNLEALSVKGGYTETATEIPTNLYIKVTLADKFDVLNPNLDEVSEATSRYAMRHGKRRHFLLMHGGRVVGWAAFHRKPRPYAVQVDYVTSDSMIVYAKSEREAKRLACASLREAEGDDVEITNVIAELSE